MLARLGPELNDYRRYLKFSFLLIHPYRKLQNVNYFTIIYACIRRMTDREIEQSQRSNTQMRSQPSTPLPEQQRPVWLSSNGDETIQPEYAKSFTKRGEFPKGDSNSLINRDMGDRRSSFQLSRQSTPMQPTPIIETQKASHEIQKGIIERGEINFPPPSSSTWLSGSSKMKGRLELMVF